MKIEALTVSIGQPHLLEQIVSNKDVLDRWLVVTHPNDVMTKRACKRHGLEFTTTTRVFENAPFAKGRAVNDGLSRLDKDGWVLHIDGDILLPATFRSDLEEHVTDLDCLYYTRRLFKGIPPRDYWKEGGPIPSKDRDEVIFHSRGPTPLEEMPEEYHILNREHGFQSKVDEEYTPRPYGFFQLWNPIGTGVDTYSEISLNADIDDVRTSYKFYPNWRLIPIVVYDLNPWLSNWEGPPGDIVKR